MHLNVATRFSAAIVGVTLLAATSSAVALVSLWRTGSLMQELDRENEQVIRTAKKLSGLLLQQKGLVASYILSAGDRSWLNKLEVSKRSFDEQVQKARRAAHGDEEIQRLVELETVYERLGAARNGVIAQYDRGETTEAKEKLLSVVNGRLYDEAYTLCEAFIEANEHDGDAMMLHTAREIRWVTWLVLACVAATLALGAALLLLFFRGVFFPLRHVVADARAFAGARSGTQDSLAVDELRAVGVYLRTLMSDVNDARSALDRSHIQLLNAEKMASVGKLAASVAHEIRNPLTAIKMWLFSIRKAVGGDADLDRRFEVVAEELNRLERIVRNFLEFARPAPPKLQAECVGALLDKTLELFTPRIEAERIHLVRDDAPDLPPALLDAEQIRQVWINLLNNAAEAAGAGGEIRVRTCVEPGEDGRPVVVLRIQNTGPAMPAEVRQRIFEPFFTTKDHGTGLGLCIAARIVAQHQGRLVLETSRDGETSFAVRIPADRSGSR